MEQVNTIVRDIVVTSETVLNRSLDNVYISTTIKVLIGLYAAFAAPKLPPSLVDLMDNILVRVAFAFMIVLTATRDTSISLMIAIAFIVTLQTANRHRLINSDLSVAAKGQSSWLPSAKKEQFDDLDDSDVAEGMEEPTEVSEELPDDDEDSSEGNEDSSEGPGSTEFYKNNNSPYFTGRRQEDFEVMGESLISNNLGDDNLFTTNDQFVSAQDNTVPGANQRSCPTTHDNQHCAQGLSENTCLLYTSPSPRDVEESRMPSSA